MSHTLLFDTPLHVLSHVQKLPGPCGSAREAARGPPLSHMPAFMSYNSIQCLVLVASSDSSKIVSLQQRSRGPVANAEMDVKPLLSPPM